MPLRALGINAFTAQPDGTLKMTWTDTRPACINGALCECDDRQHWIDNYHPKKE